MPSTKQALHELVDRLPDERTEEAANYLQRLVTVDGAGDRTEATTTERRMGPPVMSGREFRTQAPMDWHSLAAQQGVRPVDKIEDLYGDFWPEEESIDEFLATVRAWRREGG